MRLTDSSCRDRTQPAQMSWVVLGLLVTSLVCVAPAQATPAQGQVSVPKNATSMANGLSKYAKFCSQKPKSDSQDCRKLALDVWNNLSPATLRAVEQKMKSLEQSRKSNSETGLHNPQSFLVASGVFSVIMDIMTRWSEHYETLSTTLGLKAESADGVTSLKKALRLLVVYIDMAPTQLRGTAAIWGMNMCSYLKHVSDHNPWFSGSTQQEFQKEAKTFFAVLKEEFAPSRLKDAKQNIDSEHTTRALSLHNWVWKRGKDASNKLLESGDLLSVLMTQWNSLSLKTGADDESRGSEESAGDEDGQAQSTFSENNLQNVIKDNMVKALPHHTTFFWHYLVAETARRILKRKEPERQIVTRFSGQYTTTTSANANQSGSRY